MCYYRDKQSINKFQIAKVTKDGASISEPFAIETTWNYRVRPSDIDFAFFDALILTERESSLRWLVLFPEFCPFISLEYFSGVDLCAEPVPPGLLYHLTWVRVCCVHRSTLWIRLQMRQEPGEAAELLCCMCLYC